MAPFMKPSPQSGANTTAARLQAEIFGLIGTFGREHALFCKEHMDIASHEDVVSKRCEHDGCKTCPSFGLIGKFGSEHALFCKEHMNTRLHENVIDKRCEHDGCKTQAVFGPIGTFGKEHVLFCKRTCRPRETHERPHQALRARRL